jgi:hypothetical protein
MIDLVYLRVSQICTDWQSPDCLRDPVLIRRNPPSPTVEYPPSLRIRDKHRNPLRSFRKSVPALRTNLL